MIILVALELKDVEKSYGDVKVLKGLNLEVRQGEIFGLLGPNGVGKTTLFRTILGLLHQDSGEIMIGGVPHDHGKEIRRKLGYLPSDISFYGHMNAIENLEFFSRLADTEPDIGELIELVGLEEDAHRKVKEYSTGMKKRLGIPQSLIKNPEIIIYDEPTTGLDPEGKRNFRRHVKKINRQKDKTVIISSHITTEISDLCDRFGIMKDGKIVASGTKAELSSRSDSDLRIELEVRQPGKTEDLLDKEDLKYEKERRNFTVFAEGDIRSRLFDSLIEKGVEVEKVDLKEETLETTYLELTED